MTENTPQTSLQKSAAKVRSAIESYQKKEISPVELLRVLLDHHDWCFPCSVENNEAKPRFFSDEEGKGIVLCFSDIELLKAAQTKTGQEISASNENGVYSLHFSLIPFLQSLGENISKFVMNTDTEYALFFNHDQIPLLKTWARTLQLEIALSEDSAYPVPPLLMLEFPHYFVIVHPTEENQMVLLPDNEGRKLAPVFTAQDAVERFYKHVEASGVFNAPPKILSLPGENLFRALSEMEIDGFVFNCAGPTEIRAFKKEFAAEILKSKPSPEKLQ